MSYAEREMPEQKEPLDPAQEVLILRQQVQELNQRIKELDKRNKVLEESSRKDGLTDLDNRRTLEEEIRREVSGALRTGQPISVIMADIDHFKSINDQEGHLAGDTILISLASILKKGTRQTDRACRYGGEEFMVILPDTNLHQAIGVAERLRRNTETCKITIGDKTLNITASLGIATFFPEKPNSSQPQEDISQGLISFADQAMYGAKRAGRNRTGFMDDNGKIGVLEKEPTSSKMRIRYLEAEVAAHP